MRALIKQAGGVNTLMATLLALVVLMISLSPRLDVPPLSQLFGRSAELRLQDIWLVPGLIIAISIAATCRQVRQSPWKPWLLITFVLLLIFTCLAFITSDTFAYAQLGYAARFFQLYALIFAVAVLRYRSGPVGDVFVLAALSLGFVANAINAFVMQLQGERASYSSLFTDSPSNFYGPSMLNEPNSLSSGLYFVAGGALISALYLAKRINPAGFFVVQVAIATILLSVGDRASLVAFIGVLLLTFTFKIRPTLVLASASIFIGLWFVIARLADIGVGYWRFQSRYLWESADARSRIWLDNFGEIMERPLLGWGPGGASAANNFVGISEPHNAYIRILQEYGLLGTVTFGILVVIILMRQPLRVSLRNPIVEYLPFQFVWMFALKAYLVALLVAGILTDSFTTTVSWHMLAIFGGLAWGSTTTQTFTQREIRPLK